MIWPENSRWWWLAVAYLIAFPCMVVGVAWILIIQATRGDGSQVPAAAGLVLAGQLVITSIALAGRRYAVIRPGSHRTWYHQVWTQLSAGLALPGAVGRVWPRP